MFAPLVIALRQAMGRKSFMKLRGKMIAQHARIINQACRWLGLKSGENQQMLRLAHANGKRLGLLA